MQIDKEWRVVVDTDSVSNESNSDKRLRPLPFDEQQHKSLNSELKYLYTAITRAKCNLWIYDEHESKRLPIFDYWKCRELVRVVVMEESQDNDQVLFMQASTPEQWQRQGDIFKKKGLYEPAKKCYMKAGATMLAKEADAYIAVQKATQQTSHKDKQMSYLRAAESFLLGDSNEHSVKFLVNAAKCLRNAKEYQSAARLFQRLEMFDDAVKSLHRGKYFTEAARLYEGLGKVGNSNSLAILLIV